MPFRITRRLLVASGLAATTPLAAVERTAPRRATPAAPAGKPAPAPAAMGDPSAAIQALEAKLGGRIGVASLDLGSGAQVQHRAEERFALCSTYKFLAAACVLGRADRGDDDLRRRIPFGRGELVEYSPVTKDRTDGDGMSLAELCEAAMVQSDNTAANLLIGSLGGPGGLTMFAKSLGDDATRLDRPEPDLNEVGPSEVRDTTTPAAMLGNLRRILLENMLTTPSREQLTNWMLASKTGDARLRAGLPKTWRVADRTGTGYDGAAGDIAVLYPPDRAPIAVAVYLSGSKAPTTRLNDAFVQIARLLVGG